MATPQPPLPFPDRASDAHKGDFGRVLLVGGSRGMSGAISLASIAALKTGSGLVSAAVPDRCLETVAGFHLGIMTIPLQDNSDGEFGDDAQLPVTGNYDAIGCGPGMRTGHGATRLVERLLERVKTARILDADALNVVAANQLFDSPALPRNQSQLILTPHPGELTRLTGVPPNDRNRQIEAAAELADRFGLTVVVKGGPTVVLGRSATSKMSRYINETGNPGMATAGSGDVLTGIITSLVGQGLAPFDAACLGVYIHGRAGDIAAEKYSQPSMTCSELLECIPGAIRSL